MNRSNRNALAAAIVLALAAPVVGAQQQVFYQGFDICELEPSPPATCYSSPTAGGAGTYSFAPGWLLRNVDNRTPAAAVAYVNEAWEVREDFKFTNSTNSNTAAFSTSWYTPAGQADDWMWSPPITLPVGSSQLSWRAVAYDASYRDGYEVRVMAAPNVPSGGTGVLGNQVSASTQVFSTAAEQTAWTPYSLSLNAYSGQTVYVGFHNNSNDKFVLLIDDVTVTNLTPDAMAQAPVPNYSSQYTRAPAGFTVPADVGFTAVNLGAVPLTNVVGTATYKLNGNPVGTPLTTAPIATIAAGGNVPVIFGTGHMFHGKGTWTVQYDVSATETPTETNTANNSVQSPATVIGGDAYTRADDTKVSTLGIGAGNGGEMGAQLSLYNDATIIGIRFGMTIPATIDDGMGNQIPNPFIGAPLVANLRAYDNTTPPGKPGALIDSTVSVPASDSTEVYDVLFSTGPQVLTRGTYVITVSEPNSATAGAMPLNIHTDRFAMGVTWVNWPTNPTGDWANLEAFGASFQRMPEVAMLVELPIFADGFDLPAASRPAPVAHGPQPFGPTRPLRRPTPTSLTAPR